MAISHKIDYTTIKATVSIPHCMKQSWDAQKIWMKWLKVSVSFSLFLLLESSEKDIASHVGCSKSSISRVISAVALKNQAACVKQKKTTPQDDRQLCHCQDQQVLVSHPTLPKVELWFGVRSLYCNHLSSSPGDGLPLPQTCNKALLNRKQKLKRL